MKIVYSTNDKDKVGLFLLMVDSDESGAFDFGEIQEICMLTFENKKTEPTYDQFGNIKEDILVATAAFQAKHIFNLLNYEVTDEIPIEVFQE